VTAPELTKTEQATVARFEAAEAAEESWACACGHDGLPEKWHSDQCLAVALEQP
jgi:hypothetical protein